MLLVSRRHAGATDWVLTLREGGAELGITKEGSFYWSKGNEFSVGRDEPVDVEPTDAPTGKRTM